jgi:hypothetical protein
VEVLAGGVGGKPPQPARARRSEIGGVSGFGAIPGPTVTVRMKVDGSFRIWRWACLLAEATLALAPDRLKPGWLET